MQLSVLNGTTVAPRSREVASFASKNRSKKIHPQRVPALETRSRSLAVGKVPRSTNVLCSAASATGAPTGTSGSVDENSVLDAVIVGAGISGLTTALVRFFCHEDKILDRVEFSPRDGLSFNKLSSLARCSGTMMW